MILNPPAQPPGPDFFSPQIAKARRFWLSLGPSPEARLAVACGGLEFCTQDYEIHRDLFPFWSLEFVTHGHGRLLLAGEAHDLVPGTVFSYGPGIPHDMVSGPGEGLVKYFVCFTGTEAEELVASFGPAPGRVLRTSAPHELLALFESLLREGLAATPLSPRLTALVLEQLILKTGQTSLPSGVADTPAFSTYLRCRRTLEEHWPELDSLAAAAHRCHIDAAYLCRLFRRFDGQSPYQLLLKLRIARAAERLLAPGVSVKEVAEELGFADAFHLSRTFKKLMGLPPTAFTRFRARSQHPDPLSAATATRRGRPGPGHTGGRPGSP